MQAIVENFMQQQLPVHLVLPAFPFKSPNCVEKVTGTLPDAGEEIALKRLDSFCCRVEEFYPKGAHILVFSDGRVFNDLLGVSDETVHAYNKKCQEIVESNHLTHISFDNLENHMEPNEGPCDCSLIDRVMQRFMPDFDVEQALKREDLLNTYVGFRSFLALDLNLRWSSAGPKGKALSRREVERLCKVIAKQMITRNQAFSTLVNVKYPDSIRLSIHAGNTQGPKFSISLINKPNSKTPAAATPWHNVLVENRDGEVFAVKKMEVDLNKYELVVKNGQPWAYREKENPESYLPSSRSEADISVEEGRYFVCR